MKIIVTGGLGFIGSHCISELLKSHKNTVINIDKQGVGSNLNVNYLFRKNKNYDFKKINLIDYKKTFKVIKNFLPDIIIHFAAESHVDRSISSPYKFIENNILSSTSIAESVRSLAHIKKIIIINISTDEVYGSSLKKNFKEDDKLNPNSPYSSSKASSDLLFHSYFKTFGTDIITTHTCNNFGERQNIEKFIPTVINCLKGNKKIPIYGNGKNIREWIYVKDNVNAILKIIKYGKSGENYNIGSGFRMSNIEIVKSIIKKINFLWKTDISFYDVINFVEDRKGHDFRYALNSKKISKELNFKIKNNFDYNLTRTIKWYLNKK